MSLRSVAALAAVLGVFGAASSPASAQHEAMPAISDTTTEKPPVINVASGPLSISMDRMGSGTTWIPDAVTLPSRHKMSGAWEVMAHGFVFGQYDNQSGRRGADQFGSLNWAMLMA